MKRTDNILNRLLYLVAVAGLLIFALSCQREDLGPAGETCTLTYKVELPLEFDTKAAAAYKGGVNQLIYEVHYKKGEEYIKLYQQEAVIQNGSVELPVELVRDQDYMVLFWAQVKDKNIYDTDDLSAVTLSDTYTVVSSGDFEAFFGSDHVTDGTISENGGNIGLIRAVSQLNIATDDLKGQTISKVDVTVSGISNTFNVMDGDCGTVDANTSVAISYQPGASASLGEFNRKPLIFSNFVGFTPIDQTTRVNVNFTVTTTDGASATQEASGVPVKPNYKSNITGDFVPALVVATQDEWNALVNTVANSSATISLDNKKYGTSSDVLNIQWTTTIENGTLGCNVNVLNNTVTFSNVVFSENLNYDAGNLIANGCTFNGTVTTNTLTGNGTVSFTNCDFTNKELVINLSNWYQFSKLNITGTKNLSTLILSTNRKKSDISQEDTTYLQGLLTNNSFTKIVCKCSNNEEIEINNNN